MIQKKYLIETLHKNEPNRSKLLCDLFYPERSALLLNQGCFYIIGYITGYQSTSLLKPRRTTDSFLWFRWQAKDCQPYFKPKLLLQPLTIAYLGKIQGLQPVK